jgi:hypothetical protein
VSVRAQLCSGLRGRRRICQRGLGGARQRYLCRRFVPHALGLLRPGLGFPQCRSQRGQPRYIYMYRLQQGRYVARTLRGDLAGKLRKPFRYFDKGQMATIGVFRAVCQAGPLRFAGLRAWLVWIAIHIFYLSSMRNRFFVLLRWIWSLVTMHTTRARSYRRVGRPTKHAAPADASGPGPLRVRQESMRRDCAVARGTSPTLRGRGE